MKNSRNIITKIWIATFAFILLGNQIYAQLNYTLTVDGGDVSNSDFELLTACAKNIDYTISGLVINRGDVPINSFDIMVNGKLVNSFEVDIQQNDMYRYEIADILNTGITPSTHTVDLLNVNGSNIVDSDIEDNTATIIFDPIETASGKVVLVEELTGMWCAGCPRGTVYLAELEKRFGNQIASVAVHQGDILSHDVLNDNLIDALPIIGYPTMVVDRSIVSDPYIVVSSVIESLQIAPIAHVEMGGKKDGIWLETSAVVTFDKAVQDINLSVAAIIVENDISEIGSDYEQSNVYAQGPEILGRTMGGFAYFDISVPAAWWPYSHVSRQLIGGYSGNNEIIGDFSEGDVVDISFDIVPVNSDWITDNMKVVVFIMDAENGQVINASTYSYSDIISNGIISNVSSLSSSEFTVYPNPSADLLNIKLELPKASYVDISIVDILGKEYINKRHGCHENENVISIKTAELSSGLYICRIINDEISMSKEIIIQK